MADDWQIEAVKEQFKVLNSLTHLQKDVDTNNVRNVIEAVTAVLREHLHPKNTDARELVRSISVEIINQHIGNVKLGFIVIVTDKKVNGQLTKIPIFIIQFENKTVFIDMNCLTCKSWNAFLKNIDKTLPKCKFSFPVDGQYRDDKRLNVKFDTTIAKFNHIWTTLKWGIVAVAAAATALYNTTPMLNMLRPLLRLAENFVPSLQSGFIDEIYNVLTLIGRLRNCNGRTLLECCPQIFNTLFRLHNKYKHEIDSIKDYMMQIFSKVWTYLRNLKNRILGFVTSEMRFPIRLLSIISNTNADYIKSIENNGSNEDNLYTSQIFENCQNEYALHYNIKSKSDVLQDLAPFTKDVLNMSMAVMKKSSEMQSSVVGQQENSQNDLVDIFLSIRSLIQEKYEKKFARYEKCLQAATESAGHEIDIGVFNKSLGIHGNPKTHLMMKSLEKIKKSSLLKIVHEKCFEIKEKEPVNFIHIVKDPNNEKLGVYRVIGRGKKLLPAKTCLQVLSSHVGINENNFAVKEERENNSSKITLLCDDLAAFISQEINEDKDMEGMLLLVANPSA